MRLVSLYCINTCRQIDKPTLQLVHHILPSRHSEHLAEITLPQHHSLTIIYCWVDFNVDSVFPLSPHTWFRLAALLPLAASMSNFTLVYQQKFSSSSNPTWPATLHPINWHQLHLAVPSPKLIFPGASVQCDQLLPRPPARRARLWRLRQLRRHQVRCFVRLPKPLPFKPAQQSSPLRWICSSRGFQRDHNR